MDRMIIELPQSLSEAIQQRHISRQRLEGAVISFLDVYLRELDRQPVSETDQLAGDGAAFARRVIANNRELFETLAKL